MMKKNVIRLLTICSIVMGLSSFTEDDENSYGTCDKSNSNTCKITKKDGTVVVNSTGAWIAP